jgi:hypothetical protein
MNAFPGIDLSGLRAAIQHRMQQKKTQLSRSSDILGTVERVVDGTDGKIRLVSGYRKKLKEAVGCAMEYTDEMVDQIPGAIEVSRSTFVSNPYVNAFFVNVSDLQEVFSHSSEVREYMEDISHLDSPQCCALLCMRKTEKTVMGVELSADTLKRDVQRTAVSFSEHQIYSPAPSEVETREGLKHCLFAGLITNALEHIVQLRLTSHRLRRERQLLLTRLRHCRRQHATTKLLSEIADIHQRLSSIDEQLSRTHVMTPGEALQQVKAVFSRPDSFVKFSKCSLRLDKMGFKIRENSRQACNQIDLTEVKIGDESPRVVTLATFPRDELLPRKEFLAQGSFS